MNPPHAPHQLPVDARPIVESLDDLIGSMIEGDRAVDALVTIRAAGDVLAARSPEAAAAAIGGVSNWSDVGGALGITKQAAHQRLSANVRAIQERIDEAERAKSAKITAKYAKGRAQVDAHDHDHPVVTEKLDQVRAKLDKAEQKERLKLAKKTAAARAKISKHLDVASGVATTDDR